MILTSGTKLNTDWFGSIKEVAITPLCCSSVPSQAAPHLKDDSAWPRSHHRVESSPSYDAARQPVTHTLTTLSTTTSSSATSSSPNTINPLISAMQSAPLIVPYPSEDHSYIGMPYVYTLL